MTPANQQPGDIAAALSSEEWAALEYIQTNGSYPINDEDKSLTNFDRVFLKGLLNKIYNQGIPRYFLNVYGNAILEARASAPVAGKPATVTAKEFVEQGYAEKVAKGECVVRFEGGVTPIIGMEPYDLEAGLYCLDWKGGGGGSFKDDALFSVEWLTPPQPAPSQPKLWETFNPVTISAPAIDEWATKQPVSADNLGTISIRVWQEAPYWCYEVIVNGEIEVFGHGYHSNKLAQAAADNEAKAFQIPATKQPVNETAADSGADDDAIQARALDAVSTEWVQLHQLISEALGLEFLPNEDIERYEEAIKALRDQNKRLRVALEQIASKSDPERPKKWDAEMDTSFGITLGWWSAGQIARKALDDLRQAAKEGEG